jgi:hypothetical protein
MNIDGLPYNYAAVHFDSSIGSFSMRIGYRALHDGEIIGIPTLLNLGFGV